MGDKRKAVPVLNPQAVVDPISILWPRLMSVQTAARYLDCTPWHIEDLCRSGAIVAFKEGKRWAIDRQELDRYVSRRHAEARMAGQVAAGQVAA
jgi:excisionase family DNA binding protein